MRKQLPEPPIVVRGRIVGLEATILNTAEAARFLAISVHELRAKRARDVRARAAGRPTEGPRWFLLGATIFYRTQDLLAYFEERAVPFGTAAGRSRSPRRTTEPDPAPVAGAAT